MEVAETLAGAIVNLKLAACVQILPPMTSVYFWDGEIQKEKEYLMLIKTLPEKWEALRDFISEHHSHEVPEIVAVDGTRIFEPYREWLTSVIGDKVNHFS